MSKIKILVACTLRDFKNDEHHKTQLAFLNSIKNQTYQNYLIVVTNFFEKNLKKNLDRVNVKYKLENSKLLDELKKNKSKYSHWEWIYNSIKYVKGKTIIVSSLSDIIYEKNFFMSLVSNYYSGICGTSWPQINYKNLDDFKKKKKFNISTKAYINHEFRDCLYKTISDVYFFDSKLLLLKKNKELFMKSKIAGVGQGIFQALLFNFYNQKRINLYFSTKIHNILNFNSKSKKEERMNLKNNEIFNEFCIKMNINKIYWNQNSAFKKLLIYNSYYTVGNIFEKSLIKIVILKNFFYLMCGLLKKKILKKIR